MADRQLVRLSPSNDSHGVFIVLIVAVITLQDLPYLGFKVNSRQSSPELDCCQNS